LIRGPKNTVGITAIRKEKFTAVNKYGGEPVQKNKAGKE